jgi:hypothetical protein
MGFNTEEKRIHTAVRLGRGLPPHRVTRLGISPGIDAAEAATFRAVAVQDFDGVAVQDGLPRLIRQRAGTCQKTRSQKLVKQI